MINILAFQPMWEDPKEREAFAYIKDRLTKKLNGWRYKLLSSIGREVLVKVVAQAMPIFFPNHVAKIFISCVRNFDGGYI